MNTFCRASREDILNTFTLQVGLERMLEKIIINYRRMRGRVVRVLLTLNSRIK